MVIFCELATLVGFLPISYFQRQWDAYLTSIHLQLETHFEQLIEIKIFQHMHLWKFIL
jgi:hypothetical protein